MSVALPVSTLAAVANIDIGGGPTLDLYPRAATPTQVSPGNVAGFYLHVENEDAANLSTFFLNAASNATPVGAYFTKNGTSLTNCPIDGGKLGCNFGALNSGDVLQIVAAFRIPASAPASDPYCLPAGGAGYAPDPAIASVCVDFKFGSNSGFVLPKKNGNNSRGDEYHWYDFVATNVDVDAGAGFPFCNQALLLATPPTPCDTNLLTVFNAGHASRNDVQTTSLTAPSAAFNSLHATTGLAVHDNLNPAFSCPEGLPSTATCSTHQGSGAAAFLGQWSQVDANSEANFGTAFIRIDVEMYGVNPNSVDGVIHLYQVGTTWYEEVIGTKCPDANGPVTNTPCFWASGSGNVADVSIWTHNNGTFRTF